MTKDQLKQIEGHTPGPWRIYFGKSPTQEPGFNFNQIKSNSLLLSSSPRILAERSILLAACKSVLGAVTTIERQQAISKLKSAIAFAESE